MSTLVILNPLQRVKNPQAAYHRQKASGFFALRAQNDNRICFFFMRTNPACAKLYHYPVARLSKLLPSYLLPAALGVSMPCQPSFSPWFCWSSHFFNGPK